MPVVLYGDENEATMNALEWLASNGIDRIDCREANAPYQPVMHILPVLIGESATIEGFSPEAYKTFFSK